MANQVSEASFNPWLHRYYRRFSANSDPGNLGSVVFLIGSPDISGGTYVIFQHALWLKKHGVEVTMISLFPKEVAANNWHPALSELDFATFDEVEGRRFDVAVVTWWPTVYELPRVRFRHAVYFVQSMESRMEAEHDPRAAGLAELTYTFGLPVITIALWMQSYLAFHHGAPSFLVRNGIDKSLFSATGPAVAQRPTDHLRILIEGAVHSRMKGVDRAIEVARGAAVEDVWLLTPSEVRELPGVDRVFSRLPIQRLGEVYRSCHVLLKTSRVEGMYGPPLEMFHCGGTVVTNDVTGHEEFVESGYNGLVIATGDDAAAREALQLLERDPGLLAELTDGANATAKEWPSWERSSREFGRILANIARQPAQDVARLCRELLGAFPLDQIVNQQSDSRH